ncbi:hypothetical protein CCACVL1_18090 [Corchorus capsularis]|uniref:Uncharacterized protein n=1 Tax=Corchorus capsularis TaxID=210143 RepID=A0A1R3HN34_COCAP|nr:hypothetical protein CCACVL1_18090 [Corchorus capsularis]
MVEVEAAVNAAMLAFKEHGNNAAMIEYAAKEAQAASAKGKANLPVKLDEFGYSDMQTNSIEEYCRAQPYPPLRQMKILIFNAPGASNPEFIYTYAEICFEHFAGFVIITETRLTEPHSKSMNFTASTSLEPMGHFGSSWFVWNTNRINFRIIARTHKLTFKISFKS